MRKIIAIAIIALFLTSPLQAHSITKEKPIQKLSITEFPIKLQTLDIYFGKRNSSVVTYVELGGAKNFPLNFTDEEFQDLLIMRLAVGAGYRWWLWYHRAIWPDIPPGISLILVYNGTTSDIVTRAKALAAKISEIYGIDLQPVAKDVDTGKGITVILFYQVLQPSYLVNFVDNNILPLLSDNGLGGVKNSPKISDNILNDKYFRGYYALLRDIEDMDNDSDTDEFVPITGLAFVSPESIEGVGNDTYRVSLDTVLGLDMNYTYTTGFNYSRIRFHSMLPLEVLENESVIPDNPYYEYSGILNYNLKVGAYERTYLPLEDVYVVFKPFNAREELKTMPKVYSAFFITNVTTTYIGPAEATKIQFTYMLKVVNGSAIQDGFALFPMPYSIVRFIEFLNNSGYSVDEIFDSGNWTANYNASYRDYRGILLNTTIGTLNVNETFTANFSITIPNLYLLLLSRFPIYSPIGPITYYRDSESKLYVSIANGFLAWPGKATVAAWLEMGKGEYYPDESITINAKVHVRNFGPNTITNVKVNLIRMMLQDINSWTDIRTIATGTISSIDPKQTKSLTLTSNQKIRPGFWTLLGTTDFEVGGRRFTITTNGFGLLIVPASYLYRHWIRFKSFPMPHAELEINKNVTIQGNELVVEIKIRNVGDVDTTLNIVDWWNLEYVNTSEGFHGLTSFRVNTTEVSGVDVRVINDLGVVRIISVKTNVPVNTTIVIRYTIALKSNVNASNIVVNPTIVKYVFGEVPPESGERPDKPEMGGQGSAPSNPKIESAIKLASNTLAVAQQNEVETYTNPVYKVTQSTGETSGESGEEGGQTAPKSNIIRLLLPTIIIVAIIIAVVFVLKKRK